MTEENSGTNATPPDDDERALAHTLSLSLSRIIRSLRGLREHGSVTATQLSAMAALAEGGAMTPSKLAAIERVQPPSMTRMVGSLISGGLVTRQQDPMDGRQVILSLTKRGREVLANESTAREMWFGGKLAQLTPHERKVLSEAASVMMDMTRFDDRLT